MVYYSAVGRGTRGPASASPGNSQNAALPASNWKEGLIPASSSCTFVPSPPSTSTPPIATPPTSRSQTIQNVPGSNALNLHNSLACLILGNTTSPTPGSPPSCIFNRRLNPTTPRSPAHKHPSARNPARHTRKSDSHRYEE